MDKLYSQHMEKLEISFPTYLQTELPTNFIRQPVIHIAHQIQTYIKIQNFSEYS